MWLMLLACATTPQDTSAPPMCALEDVATWSEAPHLSREGVALASDGERLLAVGGWDGGALSDQIDALEPGSEAWQAVGSLPTPREHATAAVLGDRLLVFGGDDGTAATDVWSAPLSDLSAWRPEAPLPSPRTFQALAHDGEALILIGGMDARGKATAEVWQAEIDGDQITGWQSLPPLPAPRFAAGAALSGDTLTVAGGAPSFSEVSDAVYQLPPGGDWDEAGALPVPSLSHGLLSRGGQLVLLGGYDWETATTEVWTASAQELAWQPQAPLPAAVFSGGAALHDDAIWLVGGWIDTLGRLSPQSARAPICEEAP